MKIRLNDAFSEVVDKYLKDEDKARLTEAAKAHFCAYERLTIGELDRCINGDYSCVLGEICGTWGQVYWQRGFVEWASKLPELLANLSPKMDADEERAADGLLPTTLTESMLVFVRNYFGLHSFHDAEQIEVGEMLIAKKAVYNEITFKKKLSAIQMAKAKQKRK